MREIVLDTETTGLNPLTGDRVVEIGCVELFNHLATGRHFHAYVNPERDMPPEAERVHGLSAEFLSDKPVFSAIVGQFLEFIGEDPLVIHNADFDMGFLNAELVRHGFPALARTRAIDTVSMARTMFPGAPASLDALCKRFEVDASARTMHGALLDAQLLAEVYLEMRGGRQPDLAIAISLETSLAGQAARPREFRTPRPHAPSATELAAHTAFLLQLKEPLWSRTDAGNEG